MSGLGRALGCISSSASGCTARPPLCLLSTPHVSSHHLHLFIFRRAVRVTGCEVIYSPLVLCTPTDQRPRTTPCPWRADRPAECNNSRLLCYASARRRTPFRVPHTIPCECVAEDPAHGESRKSREGRPLVESKRNAGQGAGFSEPQDLLAAAAGDPCRVVLERDHRLLGFVLELEGLDLSAACLGSEVRACAS